MNINKILKNATQFLWQDELNQLEICKAENKVLTERVVENEDWELSEKLIKKYPAVEIYYPGRTFPNSTKTCDVPVNVLITKNDPKIINDLKSWGFYNSTEDWETLIPKVYAKIHEVYYRYATDEKVWGKSEIWEFPFELFRKYQGTKISADCDSWAQLQVSYYRALGLPAGFVWVVVGNCSLGGHSTVYVYSKKDKKFHHLNSTYGTIYKHISDYPLHSDAKTDTNNGRDYLGIYNVWMSFNDLVARSTFKNKEIAKFLEE